MLVNDGGGYGGTDWSSRDVVTMWSMVQSQDTDPHWKLVAGWRKTFELTSQHLYRLKDYRERLAEAWPPERSPASATYISQLDYLIGHVQQTYDAAVVNYDAFAGATGAISTARYELKKIYDEYVANQTKLEGYSAKVAAAKEPASPGRPQPSPGPSPVPSGRQEQLTYQARSLMYSLSGELLQAKAAIRQPPPYAPPKIGRNTDKPESFGGGGDVVALPPPPVIPPITTTSTPAFAPAAPPSQAPVQPPFGQPGVGGGGGPVLGGVGTLPPPGTMNPTWPPPVPTVPPPPPTTGIIGPPLPPPIPPAMKPTTGMIGNPVPSPRPGGPAMSPPRPMPPGGVIGSVGRPAAAQPTAARVNPVGGVIGQRPSSGASTRAVSPPMGRGGHRPGEEETPDQYGKPDNPWETDEGVHPVVLPPAQIRRVDPGPAIGFDR